MAPRSLSLPGLDLVMSLETSPACAGAGVAAYRLMGAASSRYSEGLAGSVGPFLVAPIIVFDTFPGSYLCTIALKVNLSDFAKNFFAFVSYSCT